MDQQNRDTKEWRLPSGLEIFQTTREQSGHASIAGRHREAGPPLLRPNGEAFRGAEASALRDYTARHGPRIRRATSFRRNIFPSVESIAPSIPIRQPCNGRRLRA